MIVYVVVNEVNMEGYVTLDYLSVKATLEEAQEIVRDHFDDTNEQAYIIEEEIWLLFLLKNFLDVIRLNFLNFLLTSEQKRV